MPPAKNFADGPDGYAGNLGGGGRLSRRAHVGRARPLEPPRRLTARARPDRAGIDNVRLIPIER